MPARFRRATIAGLIVLAAYAPAAAQSRPASSPHSALAPDRAGSASATSPSKSPAPVPSITIVTPKAGSRVHGRSIRVSVSVKGFDVVHKQFQRPVAREGHVHFYLDIKTLPKTHTYPSRVPYRSLSETSYTWTGVRPGRHTVAVQLVGNDHVPLRPPAMDRVAITVH